MSAKPDIYIKRRDNARHEGIAKAKVGEGLPRRVNRVYQTEQTTPGPGALHCIHLLKQSTTPIYGDPTVIRHAGHALNDARARKKGWELAAGA